MAKLGEIIHGQIYRDSRELSKTLKAWTTWAAGCATNRAVLGVPTAVSMRTDLGGPYLSTSAAETAWVDVSTGLLVGLEAIAIAVAPVGAPAPDAIFAATANGIYATDLGLSGGVTGPAITPYILTVATGGSVTIGANSPVAWSVLPVHGTDVGSITAAGIYTATWTSEPSICTGGL